MADLTLDANTLKTAFDNLDNKEKTASNQQYSVLNQRLARVPLRHRV
jgi:predicted negative regulator of RcsB-dependent stress response